MATIAEDQPTVSRPVVDTREDECHDAKVSPTSVAGNAENNNNLKDSNDANNNNILVNAVQAPEDVSTDRKRRRSSRETNQILLSSSRTGSLQFRRLEELFFQEEERRRLRRCRQASPVMLRMGKFSLERVYSSPNIYVIDNFLTANDLEFLQQTIQVCKRSFQKSFVDKVENTGSGGADSSLVDQSHRTSTFVSFSKQENAKVAAIEAKAAQLMGCYSTATVEPLQLVRYLPGQFFGVHHDMGDLNESTGEVTLPHKSVLAKRRLVTIFCYLNDLPENSGGCTAFPQCENLKVQPKAGRAVVFCNVTAEGLPDPRTVHAGEAVVDPSTTTTGSTTKTNNKTSKTAAKAKTATNNAKKGKTKPPVKYGLNIWICEN